MSKSRIVLCVVFLVGVAGCVTGKSADPAFSNDWLDDYKKRADFEDRKARLRVNEELIIAGKKDSARASISVDEDGNPRLNLGVPEGISADIDIDTDEAEVALKYKLKWGKPKGPLPKPREDESTPE